ncbi:hypothetical protein [Rhodoferax aquaticus]|uniref:DUF2059 domain-containing protein n=1 Tax=Rhodoferax aquaticus TaxID=2527691 RepID=A0A515EN27_9BURK|nr:hypothetical protein [Rhodoferax aquaticus]QDL54069.1 hypothetical protein EXZ61_07735 [Rhodoferax aquaticus]
MKNHLTKWLRAMLFCLAVMLASNVQACAICAPSDGQTTLLQRLYAADAVVMAEGQVGQNSSTWMPLALIKGPLPAGVALRNPMPLSPPDAAALAQSLSPGSDAAKAAVHVLLYTASNASWRSAGPLGLEREAWLRSMAALPRAMQAGVLDPKIQWPARLAALAPDLENSQSLVAQTSYEEISQAPFPAMRSLKPVLKVKQLSHWLDQPGLEARRPLYGLLFGVAGTAADAQILEPRMLRSLRAKAVTPTDLAAFSAYVAAYLELRGDAGLAWVEQHVLQDMQVRDEWVQAALQALRIHAEDGLRVSKARVVQAYALYIQSNPARAGFVASDLSKWERWEFTETFVDILKSRSAQVFSSRYAMVFYLMRSPTPQAEAGLDALRAQGIL